MTRYARHSAHQQPRNEQEPTVLGSTPITAILGAGIDNRDPEAVRAFVRQAADIGLSIMFIAPDSKAPVDLRTPQKKKADDKAAQEAAREAGRRDWARVKSPAGLTLATSDKAVLDRYLKRYLTLYAERYPEGVPVNVAVEVGGSALVVVDCDTSAQLQRFYEAALPEDIDIDDVPPPTVVTPGHAGKDGDLADPSSWAHSDGGHFYFTVPDEILPTLPRNLGAMTWGGEDGFAVLWDKRYVLIPPSTRPEGSYEVVGRDYPITDAPWLLDAIREAAARRAERTERVHRDSEAGELSEAIDGWAEATSWTAILEPLGWTPAPRADACGCPVWTAPGVHASPKSATAHDTGCALGRYTEVNAPLHIWTDNPGEPFEAWISDKGTKTLSKLQAVALIDYGGNIGKAMDEIGLTPDLAVEVDPDIAPKQVDPDHAMTGDGDFELPAAPEPETTSTPDDPPFCPVCDTEAGAFVVDGDGDMWHMPEGGSAGDEHLAEPAPATYAHDASCNTAHTAGPEPCPTPTSYADDLSDLPADFGKSEPADEPSPYAAADPEQTDPDVYDSPHSGVPRIAPFSHWRDMPPPEYVIEGLLEHGGLTSIIGPPGIGKSSVVLDMACHIAVGKRWQGRRTLKTKVLYLPGEGLAGAVQRLRAWEANHDVDLGNDLMLGDSIILIKASNEAWGDLAAYIARHEIGLVVFDTFARQSSGLEENSATDVGVAVRRYDKLRELTGAGVCVVHHTSKAHTDQGRGSSALNGALDSELVVRAATWDTEAAMIDGRLPGRPMEVMTTKQKNAEALEEAIALMMVSYEDEDAGIKAPLITGPNGSVDPMQGEIVLARPRPEAVIETAVRIRQFVNDLPTQGATRAEILTAVQADAYARSRRDSAAYWKLHIQRAVDMGLRFNLIETLTGTASGSRYIPGQVGIEQARTLAAAEVLDGD
ncbi:DNA primase/helicase [Mycobacterium phage Zonia]|uniref:DNA primase/helicase n=6 Tax=Pegunavirus oline TaxID=1986350 RepID=A0A1C9M183_9CAUD|nr:DNA primase/helicase [Mycobacterium phage Zonia]AOQ28619.1 DNA primase/helicase [Mycobacterium phage Derpp]AOQ28721.1 DNA primase/helicase [Mycobacterium phage TyrionL]AVE00514.1 DNA primase/helicase [Mycobacterium phage PhenghisKhan]AWN05639.1 DNA primase/helicase [Mycobacterium phage PhrankReynolds]AZS11059.1 DNA primase/helicase [Mycobacterium phage Wallhey]